MTNKGFTLVELMVVVLIVGILAAVAVPLLMGKVNDAKWTEGTTAAGTIKDAIKVYYVEHGAVAALYGDDLPTQADLGLTDEGLTGKYFSPGDYSWTTGITDGALTYTITVSAPADGSISSPSAITLDQAGDWTKVD